MTRTASAIACLLLMPVPAIAQDAQPPCLTDPEVRAVATWLVPDAIDGLARRCRPALDGRSFLVTSADALARRYRREDDGSDAAGRQALRKLAGDTPISLFGDGFAGAVLVEGALDRLKPEDCLTADRTVALLSPLPRASIGELAALTIFQAARNQPARGIRLPLCKSMGTR